MSNNDEHIGQTYMAAAIAGEPGETEAHLKTSPLLLVDRLIQAAHDVGVWETCANEGAYVGSELIDAEKRLSDAKQEILSWMDDCNCTHENTEAK